MSKITSLLFVLFVGTICSMTTKAKLSPFEENLLPQHSMMKRLNSVFVELRGIEDAQSNVKTFKAFVQVIESLIDDLNADTKKHAEILDEMTKKCTAEDEFRDAEVKDAKQAISNASASRKLCQEHLDKAKQLRVEAVNLLAAEEQKKKERTEIRNREHATYLNVKAQYDQAIMFMNNFISLVAERFPTEPASFIQFSESLLRHTSKMGSVEATLPVLVMMSQFVSAGKGGEGYGNMDAKAGAATLTEKLNVLLNTMVSDLAKITAVENKRQADFEAFLIKVNKNIADLKENIDRLDAQIQSNTECVARETAVINEATAKSTRNADLKEKAIKMCAKFVEEVKQAQEARRIEVGVVRQILGLMKVRFGNVPERLTDYLDSVEKGFAEYENKTKLIAYKVYKYMALNENELGKDITADKQNYVDNKKFF